MPKEPRQRGIMSLFFSSNSVATAGSNSGKTTGGKTKLRRDFCFGTPNGPVFFSTRDEFCARFGGLRHGDLVSYGAVHPLKGWRAVIVGERGGRLWAVDEGANNAHQLHAANGAEMDEKYGFTKVGTQRLTAAAPPPNMTAEQKDQLCTLPDLMVRINDGKEMQHLVPCISGEPARIGWTGVGYVHDGSNPSPDNKVYIAATAAL